MDEQEFDSLMQWRRFGTEDAKQMDLRLRGSQGLALKLWGKTLVDLTRQLAAPCPEIPAGFDLSDFRELQKTTEALAGWMKNPRNELASRMAVGKLFVGTHQYTEWEARCEILRRAIEYLESH